MQRQRFFQLIEHPDEQQLLQVFQGPSGFIDLCGEAQSQQLYSYLTLNSINEEKEYEDWSLQSGRVQCFQEIRKQLQQAKLVTCRSRQYLRLEELLARLLEGQCGRREEGQLERHQPSVIKEEEYINGESQYVSVEDQVRINLSLIDSEEEEKPILIADRLIDSRVHQRVESFPKLTPLAELRDSRGIRAAHLSEGGLLALGSNSGLVQVFQLCHNLKGSQLNKIIEKGVHKGSVLGLSWRNQKQLLSCANDGRVCLLNLHREDSSLHVVELARFSDSLRGIACLGDELFVHGLNSIHCCDLTKVSLQSSRQQQLGPRKLILEGLSGSINHIKLQGFQLFVAFESKVIASINLRSKRKQSIKLEEEPLWLQCQLEQLLVVCEGGTLLRVKNSLQIIESIRLEKALRSLSVSKEGLGLGCTFGSEVALIRTRDDGMPGTYRVWNSGQACCAGWQGKLAWVCWADGNCKLYMRQ